MTGEMGCDGAVDPLPHLGGEDSLALDGIVLEDGERGPDSGDEVDAVEEVLGAGAGSARGPLQAAGDVGECGVEPGLESDEGEGSELPGLPEDEVELCGGLVVLVDVAGDVCLDGVGGGPRLLKGHAVGVREDVRGELLLQPGGLALELEGLVLGEDLEGVPAGEAERGHGCAARARGVVQRGLKGSKYGRFIRCRILATCLLKTAPVSLLCALERASRRRRRRTRHSWRCLGCRADSELH